MVSTQTSSQKNEMLTRAPIMTIDIVAISAEEASKLISLPENHFCDLKAVAIAPAKLTKTISALSNAEGGEVYVGVAEDRAANTREWQD